MKKHRIGIVGAGQITRLHLDGLRRHADAYEAAALADPDEAMRQERAAEYGVARTYAGVAEMVAAGGLDAAVVCTPTHVRSSVVLPLLEAGIPVLCEKPLAETFAEAAELEQASRRLGVPLAVNQNFRRHFPFAMAREALVSGSLGRPLHLTQLFKILRKDSGWRLQRQRYIMSVMSIHWFDGYRLVFGQEPTSVYARAVNSPLIEGGDDTAVSVVLGFPDGAMACLAESFSSLVSSHHCVIDCQRGSLDLTMKRLRIHTGADAFQELANPMDKIDATHALLDDLLRARADGREPETSAADNLKTIAIMEAAYRSLTEGRSVDPADFFKGIP